MKSAVISIISFVFGGLFYHFFLLEKPLPQELEINMLELEVNEGVVDAPKDTHGPSISESHPLFANQPKANMDYEDVSPESLPNGITMQKGANRNGDIPTDVSTDESQMGPRVFLPTSEETERYHSEFEAAVNQFADESIDYDWADNMERNFIDLINSASESKSLDYSSFSCRETKCVLEITEADFHRYWGPFIGKAGEHPWWEIGRIHFQPYPLPETVQNYTLVFERRLNNSNKD